MEPVYNSPPLRHPSRLLLSSGQSNIVAASSSHFYRSASGTSLQQPTSKTSQQTATQLWLTWHCRSLFQSTLSSRQWNQSTTANLYDIPADCYSTPANRTLSQPLPVIFIVLPVQPVYNSRPLRHPSRLLLNSGKPDIVAVSSSQLYRPASGASLHQPTSNTTQQTAIQLRPTGHCRSLFQSTLSSRQWNQSTTADL